MNLFRIQFSAEVTELTLLIPVNSNNHLELLAQLNAIPVAEMSVASSSNKRHLEEELEISQKKQKIQEDEKERAEKEKAEKEKTEKEKAEKEKAEKEQAEKEKAEKEQAEKKQAEKEKAERKKKRKEQAEKEQAEKEQAEKEQAEKEQAEKEQAEKEQAEKEQAEKEQAEKEQAEKEQAEKEQAEKKREETEKEAQQSDDDDVISSLSLDDDDEVDENQEEEDTNACPRMLYSTSSVIDATETVIVMIGSCRGRTVKGLISKVCVTYPHADIYTKRRVRVDGKFEKVEVFGDESTKLVAWLYGRYELLDSMDVKTFRTCLNALTEALPKKLDFPISVAISKDMGNLKAPWISYQKTLEDWCRDNNGFSVTVYDC